MGKQVVSVRNHEYRWNVSKRDTESGATHRLRVTRADNLFKAEWWIRVDEVDADVVKTLLESLFTDTETIMIEPIAEPNEEIR